MDETHRGDIAAASGNRPDPELVLSHLENLPTLSAVAVRLMQTTMDPDSSAKDVVALLRGDQSLTAKILSVAGSAWTGVSSPVTTLEQAVPLLGFSAVQSIVLAASVFECFPVTGRQSEEGGFDRGEFWKHALAVACGARRLAMLAKHLRVEPHAAFVAGLLHDLGKVALSAVFPKSYDRIAAQANQSRGDIADFERSLLGMDHTVAGRRLAERWRMPRELQEVAWLHHLAADTLPASVLTPATIGVVQLADTMAREQRVGYSGNHMFYEHSPRLAARLGLQDTDVDATLNVLVQDVAQHAELLGLGREPTDAMYVQAMAQANTELSRLNTELSLSSRRLAASARYFRALGLFDQQLSAWSDPPAVVAALARAAATALQRPRVAAFGVRDNRSAVDVCWVTDEAGRGGASSQGLSEELAGWLADPGDDLNTVLARASAPVREIMVAAADDLGRGTPWLVPVVHDGQIAGGIVFRSESDERARLASEADDLRAFAGSLGLALGRANAQAGARRLSDDLAETNRRLQQVQVELLRSRALAMIAEMAAGAGHELNSPLTVISGRAQMLTQVVREPDARRWLEVISSKAHECSQIVSELMDFARPQPPRLTRVNVAELLAKVRDEWVRRADVPASSVRLHLETADAPGTNTDGAWAEIEADPAQLTVVFRELLANAADAVTESAGVISIHCRPALADDQVEVLIRDDGCGMPPSVLQRAFDPFFSHRRAGRGRGLGLPRAYRIMESHGGRIWLESVPDEGTTAHVILPRRPPAIRPPASG